MDAVKKKKRYTKMAKTQVKKNHPWRNPFYYSSKESTYVER